MESLCAAFLTTNGIVVTREVAREIARAKPASVAVSFEDADAVGNDAIRGGGSYAAALAGYRLLADAGVPIALALSIHAGNFDHMDAIVRWAASLAPKRLVVRPLYPVGRACGQPLVPSYGQFLAAVRVVNAAALGLPLEVSCADDVPHNEVALAVLDYFGCAAGNLVMAVDSVGNVLPCLFMPGAFVAGSIRDRPLMDLWDTAEPFVRLRDLRPEEPCAGCAERARCGGGCRLRALSNYGRLGAPDTYCSQSRP